MWASCRNIKRYARCYVLLLLGFRSFVSSPIFLILYPNGLVKSNASFSFSFFNAKKELHNEIYVFVLLISNFRSFRCDIAVKAVYLLRVMKCFN
jgi:hypothetical protein